MNNEQGEKTMRKVLMTLALCLGAAPAVAQAECLDRTLAATPTSDFEIHDDGTLTHKPTGLMWQQCSAGQSWVEGDCLYEADAMGWQEALQYADTLVEAGYSDWRLPNIKELDAIVEYYCHDPAINTNVFPGTASTYYWSSSNNMSQRYRAWYIDFDKGGLGHSQGTKTREEYKVRLVRDPQ